MAERVHHCPFLNRSEPRCSSHFSLNGLTDALEQCFGQYSACSVYRELLRERQARRGELPGSDAAPWLSNEEYAATTVQLTRNGHPASH